MSDNPVLQRIILDGGQFNNLIPASSCQTVRTGKGNTDVSMRMIKEVIQEYSNQFAKVAKVLQKSSLIQNCQAIKWFAYHHFQYDADDDIQYLRTPACCWSDRYNGIDCKSYSILAGSLLREMGIKFAIRRIKQPGWYPTEWTHVYIVVPIDQKTGDLSKGSYCIDGTLSENDEPDYIEKNDLFMNHEVLNGAVSRTNGTTFYTPNVGLKGFSFKDVKNIFSGLDCIGGDAYTDSQLKTHIGNVDKYFADLIIKINNAVKTDNYAVFSNLVNEYFGNSKMFVLAAQRNKMKGWNSCTSKRIDKNIQQFIFYRDVVGGLLAAWVNEYFVKTGSAGSVTYTNKDTAANYPFRHVSSVVLQSVTEPKFNYVPDVSQNIPAFELTPYIQQQLDSSQPIDLATALQQMSGVIKIFQGTPQTPGSVVIDPQTGEQTYVDGTLPTTKPSQFGMGTLVIGGLVIAAAVNIFSTMKDKPLKAK